MQICNVCSEQTPKYRCPTCKIRYCSVACYKTHKDNCQPLIQPSPITVDKTVTLPAEPWNVEDLLDEDCYTDRVPLEVLQRLGESQELRDLLLNPHLRQLMRSIDTAENKDDAMKAAMQEPLFVELSDQCLQIAENK